MDLHVGQRLRRRRSRQSMRQKDLAAALGVSYQQIQKYEKGDNRIAASLLWEACQVLDVPPAYFFEGFEGAEADTGVRDPAKEVDIQAVAQRFGRISDPTVRRQLLQLIRALESATT
jgi:transcriptional regulator with XRE-family HTH domain